MNEWVDKWAKKYDWNAKVGSQETPGVTGKFGIGIQNETGQRLIEFCQENTHNVCPGPSVSTCLCLGVMSSWNVR